MATTAAFATTALSATTSLLVNVTTSGASHPALVFHATIATYYGYYPNIGLAIWATVMFGLCWIIQTGLCIYYRKRDVLYFLVLPTVAGSMEVLSYGIRSYEAVLGETPDTGRYITQLVALIVAPIFTALANYLLLGKIVRSVGTKYSLLKPVIIERIFVLSDVASFFVQGIGASVFAAATTAATYNQSTVDTAQTILIIGFIIQLAALMVFLTTIIYVHVKTQSHPADVVTKGQWRLLFYALYTSVSFILIRSIYRVIEFEAKRGTALADTIGSDESYFGVFETGCMMIAFWVYVPLHPGFFVLPDGVAEDKPEKSDNKSGDVEMAATKRATGNQVEARDDAATPVEGFTSE